MKNIFESPETFEAYATIDCCYFMLSELLRQLEARNVLRSPLEKLIDEQTGYGAARVKKIKQQAIELCKQIIEAKKKIDADYSNDSKMLNEMN